MSPLLQNRSLPLSGFLAARWNFCALFPRFGKADSYRLLAALDSPAMAPLAALQGATFPSVHRAFDGLLRTAPISCHDTSSGFRPYFISYLQLPIRAATGHTGCKNSEAQQEKKRCRLIRH
jgi:hypothetical protein